MSQSQSSSKVLPYHPSEEFLRKEAKRLARGGAIQLATAQRQLAHEYGYKNWAALMSAVASMSHDENGGSSPSTHPAPPQISDSRAKVFPLLPLRGLVTFPHVSYPIFVGRVMSIRAVRHAADRKTPIVLVAQRDPKKADPSSSDLYQIGTLANVIQLLRLPDGTIKTVVEATVRARISHFVLNEDFSKAEALEVEEPAIDGPKIETLIPSVISGLMHRRAKTFGEEKPEAWAVAATTADSASTLADRVASELVIDLEQKQALLELLDPAERLEKLLVYLNASS